MTIKSKLKFSDTTINARKDGNTQEFCSCGHDDYKHQKITLQRLEDPEDREVKQALLEELAEHL